MTIAAGLMCSDGIVLFADTEESQGNTKTRAEKIRRHSVGSVNVVVASAGNGDLAESLIDQIFDGLQDEKKEVGVINTIRNAIIGFHDKEVRLYPSEDAGKQIELVIGLEVDKKSPLLLHANSTALRKVNEFVVVGMGAEIKFVAQQYYWPGMPLKHGLLLANFLCKTAKDYVQYCGGHSRIATLQDGQIEIRHFFDIWQDEQSFSSLDCNYHAVMFSISDEEITDAQFNNCVERFAVGAWKAREDALRGKEFNAELKEKMKDRPRRGMDAYYQPMDGYSLDCPRRSRFLLEQAKKRISTDTGAKA